MNAKISTKLDASFKYGETVNQKGKKGANQKGVKDTVQFKMVAKHPNDKYMEYSVNLNHPASVNHCFIQ